jgi:hypothetical protein
MYEEFHGGNKQKRPFRNRLITVTYGTFMKKLQMTTRNYILGLPRYFAMISMIT